VLTVSRNETAGGARAHGMGILLLALLAGTPAVNSLTNLFTNAMRHKIKTMSQTCEHHAVLTVTAGTNCPMGGDLGHGGRTIFRLTNEASTAATISINGEPHQEFEKFELILSGDSECYVFIKALEFALETLRGRNEYFD